MFSFAHGAASSQIPAEASVFMVNVSWAAQLQRHSSFDEVCCDVTVLVGGDGRGHCSVQGR